MRNWPGISWERITIIPLLRALQAVAQRSGYQLTVPSADDYQGDIDRIERAVRVPIMYAPHDFQHEALDTLPDRPVFRPDGSFTPRAARTPFS